ncbi:MAG: sugar ABC transporter ATP-binding protein [Eubacteriales bacterium]|nr:sugar ABC transporter ATP-binding protein [Eubacteriales bacterium]
MEKQALLKMSHISKKFSGNYVLSDVSFTLEAGTIHSLIGENGAGKSTLIKVLGGVYFQDEGEIFIEGEKQQFSSAKDALRAGIGIIYQEFNLVSTLSIAENIYLGKELCAGRGVLDRRQMIKTANEFMKELGFDIADCGMSVSSLSVAQQQMVEIAKALFNHSKILVLDEPTAVLTDKESRKLFDMVKKLKGQGVGIVYISHRLEEVLELSDEITVLRDGKYIEALDNRQKDVKKEELVRLMVGRSLNQYYPDKTYRCGKKEILRVQGLTRMGLYRDISFVLHEREILGITGLVGAGRTEVVKTIFGKILPDAGSIWLDGEEILMKSPMDAIDRGIAFIPENRKEEGLLLDSSIGDNMILANEKKVSDNGVFRKKKKKDFISKYFSQLDIRPAQPQKLARNFSGGNQQKAIIAKWIATNPRVLIVDEPTRGIDIGAKAEIYRLMDSLVQQGISIIMVSSEMPEIIGMCDRVLVMCEGKLQAEFMREELTQEKIMRASSGI